MMYGTLNEMLNNYWCPVQGKHSLSLSYLDKLTE